MKKLLIILLLLLVLLFSKSTSRDEIVIDAITGADKPVGNGE